MQITDPQFNSLLTLGEAYRVMCIFIERYNARGTSNTLDLLADIGLSAWRDGSSADPAQLQDFLDASKEVVNGSRSPAT